MSAASVSPEGRGELRQPLHGFTRFSGAGMRCQGAADAWEGGRRGQGNGSARGGCSTSQDRAGMGIPLLHHRRRSAGGRMEKPSRADWESSSPLWGRRRARVSISARPPSACLGAESRLDPAPPAPAFGAGRVRWQRRHATLPRESGSAGCNAAARALQDGQSPGFAARHLWLDAGQSIWWWHLPAPGPTPALSPAQRPRQPFLHSFGKAPQAAPRQAGAWLHVQGEQVPWFWLG